MTEQDKSESQDSASKESPHQSRVKLKKLHVNRETIQELADEDANRVKGGGKGEDIGAASGPVPVGP